MQMRQHVRCCGKRDVRRNRPLICGYIQPEMMVLHQLSFMITSQAGKDPVCRNFWKEFHGMVQCDGYQGYNRLEDVILVCCLAHARRKFFEAVPAARRKKLKLLDVNSDEAIEDTGLPDEEKLEQLLPAEIGLLYCNKLFYLERTLKELEAEERKQQRTILEQLVWEQFWNWLGTLHPTGGSKLGKAVNYAQNHHDTLMNYMIDGRCEISNNRAERKAKSYAVGRKAFLFHTSEAEAWASAVSTALWKQQNQTI